MPCEHPKSKWVRITDDVLERDGRKWSQWHCDACKETFFASRDSLPNFIPETASFDGNPSSLLAMQRKVKEIFKISPRESFLDIAKELKIDKMDGKNLLQLKKVLDGLVEKSIIKEDDSNPGYYDCIKKDTEANEEEPPKIYTSFIEDNEIFWEEVWDGQIASFVVWDGEEFKKEAFVGNYFPITDEEVTKGAVLLPSFPEECKVEDLIENIKSHIHKYCDVSEDFELFSTYYVLLSWVYDKINTLPYMRVLGDTGTGKSRYLNVIGRLCYKACLISGSITPAPIYRMIDKWGGSIVIDESDFKKSDAQEEIIKILNCGFEKGRPVLRCNPNDPSKLDIFNCYCPKVIATRYTFYDKALESRCLTEQMQQTVRKDIPRILLKEFYETEAQLRNKLLYFRMKYRDTIDSEIIKTISIPDIEPRLWQATASFSILFSKIPEVFEKFKQFLANYQVDLIEERSNSFEGMIVQALFELITENEKINYNKVITSIDVARKIEEVFNMEDKSVKPASVGKYCKSLGLHSKSRKIDGKTKRQLIYSEELVEILKQRYIPQVTAVTDVTVVTEVRGGVQQNLSEDDVCKHTISPPNSTVTAVTPVTESTNNPVISSSQTPQETIIKILEQLEQQKEEVAETEFINMFEESARQPIQKELDRMKNEGLLFEPHAGFIKRL